MPIFNRETGKEARQDSRNKIKLAKAAAHNKSEKLATSNILYWHIWTLQLQERSAALKLRCELDEKLDVRMRRSGVGWLREGRGAARNMLLVPECQHTQIHCHIGPRSHPSN